MGGPSGTGSLFRALKEAVQQAESGLEVSPILMHQNQVQCNTDAPKLAFLKD